MNATESPKGTLEISCEDCMALMARYPDKHFDLAIVDPPYGIGRDGLANSRKGNGKGRKGFEFKGWDSQCPAREYWDELFRVSMNQIVFGANYMTEFLPASMGWIFWDKGQRIQQSDGEFVFTSFQRAARAVTFGRHLLAAEDTFHPTQKPIALYNWILANYAAPGQRILDTHLGSGSHAIAAHYFGAHLTACEIDADYFAAATARIQRETAQTTFL